MVRARTHVVGAILQAGAVLKEPALKEAFFLLAAGDRAGDLHGRHRVIPRADDPVGQIAFLRVRVHIRQFQIVIVLFYGSRKVFKIFVHGDLRIRSILVGAIPERSYVLSDAQFLPDAVSVALIRHLHEQVTAVVRQMTTPP